MNHIYALLPLIYMCTRSCLTVNKHKHDSFLNLLSNSGNSTGLAGDAETQEESPENRTKAGSKTTIEKIKGLFKSEDKISTRKQNNSIIMEFEGYKNVRNKKEVDVHHLQVQKSSSIFTHNTDKGVLHFMGDQGKLSKGTITKATLKLNKLFDGKGVGFSCKSNAINVYLIEAPTEDLKLKAIKGPIKMEFKKDEVELDVSKFFEDVDESSASPAAPNLAGGANLLQFTDLSSKEGGEDIEFDNDHSEDSSKKGSGDGEDDFLDENSNSNEEGDGESEESKAPVEKYLMLEADEGCYFAFDVDKDKPRLKVDLTRKIVSKSEGKVKMSSITIVGLGFLGLFSLGIYFVKRKGPEHTFVFDNPSNEIMAGY